MRKARGQLERIGGQLLRELGVEQVSACGAAAVVDEAGDWLDAQPLHLRQGRRKDLQRACLAEALPWKPIAQRLEPQRRNLGKITKPVKVTAALHLIHPTITDAVDRALQATPELDLDFLCQRLPHDTKDTHAPRRRAYDLAVSQPSFG